MTLETYLAYLATVFVFFARPPGPSQLLFMAHALRRGNPGAMPVLAGDLSANALQMLAAGLGLAGAVVASANLFLTIKWAGVAFLVWTGIRLWRAAGRAGGRAERGALEPGRGPLFRQGFVTSAANPYAILFFAALFPQFIDPSEPLALQLAVLGGTYLAVDGALLLAWGGAVRALGQRLGPRVERAMGRISGALMIGAACLLALRDLGPGASPAPAR
ncbi:MAG: LysE family translocator [Pseudomonadota bacterium]